MLGSREQLCIHPEVVQLASNAAKTALCRHKVAQKACEFHQKVPEAAKLPIMSEGLMDMEDLMKLGTEHS